MAREDHRANLVARIRGARGSTASAESLAFVGHTDVVPCDPRDWTHPPFEAVVDDDGWLWGRGAVDMKNEVAARAVAMAELARERLPAAAVTCGSSRSPTRRTGSPTSACAGCSRSGPTSGPTHSINEGGGERLPLTDGREVVGRVGGREGHAARCRSTAVGEAGHASMPTLGNNAVPLLARLIAAARRRACPSRAVATPMVSAMLAALLGRDEPDLRRAIAEAEALHPSLARLDHGADGLDAGADDAVGAPTSAT